MNYYNGQHSTGSSVAHAIDALNSIPLSNPNTALSSLPLVNPPAPQPHQAYNASTHQQQSTSRGGRTSNASGSHPNTPTLNGHPQSSLTTQYPPPQQAQARQAPIPQPGNQNGASSSNTYEAHDQLLTPIRDHFIAAYEASRAAVDAAVKAHANANVFADRVGKLQAQLDSVQAELVRAQRERDEANGLKTKALKDLSTAQLEGRTLAAQLADQKGRLGFAKNQLERANAEKNNLTTENAELKIQLVAVGNPNGESNQSVKVLSQLDPAMVQQLRQVLEDDLEQQLQIKIKEVVDELTESEQARTKKYEGRISELESQLAEARGVPAGAKPSSPTASLPHPPPGPDPALGGVTTPVAATAPTQAMQDAQYAEGSPSSTLQGTSRPTLAPSGHPPLRGITSAHPFDQSEQGDIEIIDLTSPSPPNSGNLATTTVSDPSSTRVVKRPLPQAEVQQPSSLPSDSLVVGPESSRKRSRIDSTDVPSTGVLSSDALQLNQGDATLTGGPVAMNGLPTTNLGANQLSEGVMDPMTTNRMSIAFELRADEMYSCRMCITLHKLDPDHNHLTSFPKARGRANNFAVMVHHYEMLHAGTWASLLQLKTLAAFESFVESARSRRS